jgi:hypothetical protein
MRSIAWGMGSQMSLRTYSMSVMRWGSVVRVVDTIRMNCTFNRMEYLFNNTLLKNHDKKIKYHYQNKMSYLI